MSTALILGISGPDGAYPARFLLAKGYAVFGGLRDAQMHSFANLARPGALRMSMANPAKARARPGWRTANAMPDAMRLMIEREGKGGDG